MNLKALIEDIGLKIKPFIKVIIYTAYVVPSIYVASIMFSMFYTENNMPSTVFVKNDSFNDYVIAYDKFGENIKINTNFIKEIKDSTKGDIIEVEAILSNGHELNITFRDLETKNGFIEQVKFNMEKRK
ncbi:MULTISPECIES: hypothetical protein [Aliarcobacter]|uniref:hypothetical protein n=1 Tax=Aliarcobacter TaxID=2321111 RepID=UPI0021B2D2EB|nr:hypothetical protein [Aliarcobacter butzleri]MCT7597268.1 hypothetical protein [Aliarcobacter butzleri]